MLLDLNKERSVDIKLNRKGINYQKNKILITVMTNHNTNINYNKIWNKKIINIILQIKLDSELNRIICLMKLI